MKWWTRELHPESVMLWANREFVTDAIDRDTLFSGKARSSISRAATLQVMLLGVTAAFLYGFSERPLYKKDSQRCWSF